MSPENRRANIAEELRASERARETAGQNAVAGDFHAAVNRLYSAAFHAARAVCLSEGIEPKTHRGLKHLLAIHFVQAGRLPEGAVETLSRLESERDLADYVAAYDISPERYHRREEEADSLLAALREYLRHGGWVE